MMYIILWFVIGIIASSCFHFALHRYCDDQHVFTIGDGASFIIFSLFGPLTAITMLVMAFVCCIWWLSTQSFWSRPLFKRKKEHR